ncbi:unnamed protein product [Brachionus calyciflorus]|uniref:BHLH domain-containing protein n=1 Tax=Brachionus calyciflorus TaxID=104777 RepID=A0A813PTM6_9BILA|nr:unnamed protein product [Brachionus calyciflorus]
MNSTTTTTTTNKQLDDKSSDIAQNVKNPNLENNENLSLSSPITSSSDANNNTNLRLQNSSTNENDDNERSRKRLRTESLNNNENIEVIKESENLVDTNNNLKSRDTKSKDDNKIDLNQQTIIIEGGINTLQFQLKPEIIPNRQITLKLIPVGPASPNESDSLADPVNYLKTTTNLESIQQNIILNDSNNENLGILTNDLNDSKNQKSNSSPIQTVKLGESSQNVYFMMQPIDLVSNSIHSNSLKIKSPPHHNVSSTSHLNNNNNNSHSNNSLSTITLQNPGFSPSLLSTNTTTTVTLNSPVSSTTSINPTQKVVRDERRRANHNEVERRRRDNINKWIVELSKVIPDCCNDQSKHGQSKGGILEKTVQYLIDMKKQNQILSDQLRLLESLKPENDLLKKELLECKKENQFLKSKLGIECSDTQYS